MAGNPLRIDQLPTDATTVAAEDYLPISQGGVTKRITSDVLLAAAGTVPPTQYGNYVVQGGGVNWLGTGFQYTISAATYVIGGVSYASAETNLTLGAADPTNPRIDVFALTTSGTAIIIAGTAAASPAQPAVDSTTQLAIGFVFVAAGATVPVVTNTSIYLNNAEWTAVSSGARIVVNSASNPFAGSLDIEATSAIAGDTVTLTNGSPIIVGNLSNLTMQLRSKAAWANQKRLQFQWRSGVSNVGNAVQIRGTGTYGFVSSTTGAYQSISIPIADFGVGLNTADNLLITVIGGGAAFGWYLDNIIGQAGVPGSGGGSVASEDMTHKGAYNSATAYAAQDQVTLNGYTYVALQAGTGNSPTSSPTFWDKTGVGAGGVDVIVADGGTGVSSLTAYAPVFGGTTSTGAVQSGTVGTAGQALLSNGPGALPTFQSLPSSNMVVNNQTGNYTTLLSDANACIRHTSSAGSGDTITINSQANVPWVDGTCITFDNRDLTNNLTIAITTDTLRIAGSTITGSYTLRPGCITTAVFSDADNEWVIGATDTITVAEGGTGVAVLTSYAPIFGGTTSTGAVQSGTVGTSGHVLTSNGAGALPTFQANAAQPLDADLTTIAGLTATTDNFMQAKSSAWASRTPAQVAVDLQSTGLVADMVGYRNVPGNSQSTAYTTVAADSGKSIDHPSTDANARTYTIAANASVAYPVGTTISFSNMDSNVVTIAINSDTMYLAGTGTTGSRSLAQYGTATARKLTTTTWLISGVGLT